VAKNAGQFSVLFGDRAVTRVGEVAALVNVVLQDRAWREDTKGSGTPMVCSARASSGCRLDLVAGQDTVAPSTTSESTSLGRRRRSAQSLMLGWRPNSATEVYAEAHLAELRTKQDTQQINVGPNFSAGSGFDPASVALFPGSNDVSRVTWTNAPVSVLSFARDTIDRTRQLATGATWTDGPLRGTGDLSHTRSVNNLFFSGTTLAANAPRFTHDLSGAVPATAITGTDLADPGNYRYTAINYRVRPLRGSLLAARLDGDRAPRVAASEGHIAHDGRAMSLYRLGEDGETLAHSHPDFFGRRELELPPADLDAAIDDKSTALEAPFGEGGQRGLD
jgi:ferredoxin